MAFHEVQAEQDQRRFEYLKFQGPGDSVTAVYVKKFEDEGKFGKSTQVLLRESVAGGDERLWALRENGDLRSKMAKVKVGSRVRITFCGLGEPITLRDGSQGTPPNLYRVEVDDGRPEPRGEATPF
jgi:hypothetical protein